MAQDIKGVFVILSLRHMYARTFFRPPKNIL